MNANKIKIELKDVELRYIQLLAIQDKFKGIFVNKSLVNYECKCV